MAEGCKTKVCVWNSNFRLGALLQIARDLAQLDGAKAISEGAGAASKQPRVHSLPPQFLGERLGIALVASLGDEASHRAAMQRVLDAHANA